MEIQFDNHSRAKSAVYFEEAKTMFPGGVHSPVRAFKSVIGPPIFFEKGAGSRIFDVDGQEYLDFCASWGPLILGHCHPNVENAIIQQVKKGTSFGTPNPNDLQIGRTILQNHRFIEMIRFVSSGTEAVMSAVRLARGVTGKSKILKFEGCYHGHVDSLMVKAGSGLATFGISTSAGIPEAFAKETLVCPLDEPELLEKILRNHAHELAAVIIEPVPANNGLLLQTVEYLQFLRKICTELGVLLIFDEVISGFRVGFEGAAGIYNIQPDIITFGKIIGGGMPVGAYAGSRKIMEYVAPVGPVYQAGTLSANPVAMAAGFAMLNELLSPDFYPNLETKTRHFVSDIQKHADERGFDFEIAQIGSIFWPKFTRSTIRRADQIDPNSMEKFKIFHLECLKRGIYFGPSGYEVGFVSSVHTDSELSEAAEKINSALDFTFNYPKNSSIVQRLLHFSRKFV
jgi:glutamate-1-semialdehyde 2,1-aminomutase